MVNTSHVSGKLMGFELGCNSPGWWITQVRCGKTYIVMEYMNPYESIWIRIKFISMSINLYL
jgi:hypothetical protein